MRNETRAKIVTDLEGRNFYLFMGTDDFVEDIKPLSQCECGRLMISGNLDTHRKSQVHKMAMAFRRGEKPKGHTMRPFAQKDSGLGLISDNVEKLEKKDIQYLLTMVRVQAKIRCLRDYSDREGGHVVSDAGTIRISCLKRDLKGIVNALKKGIADAEDGRVTFTE